MVDASVVVKWFHDETQTKDALQLQEEINTGAASAAVPDLLLYEVANALVRGIGAPSAEITAALKIPTDMPWDIVDADVAAS